jgi:hypothetical protein
VGRSPHHTKCAAPDIKRNRAAELHEVGMKAAQGSSRAKAKHTPTYISFMSLRLLVDMQPRHHIFSAASLRGPQPCWHAPRPTWTSVENRRTQSVPIGAASIRGDPNRLGLGRNRHVLPGEVNVRN